MTEDDQKTIRVVEGVRDLVLREYPEPTGAIIVTIIVNLAMAASRGDPKDAIDLLAAAAFIISQGDYYDPKRGTIQ